MDSCPGCVYPEFYGRLEVNQVGGTLWTQRDEVFRFKASKEAEEKTYRQSRERREEKQTFFRGGGRGIPAKRSKKDRRLGGPAADGGPVPDRKDSWKWMTCHSIGRRLSLTNRGFHGGFHFHVSQSIPHLWRRHHGWRRRNGWHGHNIHWPGYAKAVGRVRTADSSKTGGPGISRCDW